MLRCEYEITTLNTAIAVDSNKSTVATRQEKKPTNFHNKSQQSCCTIKANKFHHTAGIGNAQKANEVETQRIAFKDLITTTNSAPKQTKTDHIAGKFYWKSRNKQHLNTQAD